MATIKTLPLKQILTRTMEFDIRQYDVFVPEGFSIDDLLSPECWHHHASKLRPRDLIYCEAMDGSFDIILRVKAVASGGVVMRLFPYMPMDEDVVSEPAQDSEPAQRRMVGDKPVPRVEYTKVTRWRGIGLDGNEIFRDMANKAEAEIELDRWAKSLGIQYAA